MSTGHVHIDSERMQALLDGEFSPAETAAVRASIDACPRCSAEFEAWDLLFADLDELPVLTPSPAFGERVIDSLPERAGFGAGAWLAGRAAARAAATHVGSRVLQEYLDGRLAARIAARVDRHLDGCAVCRSELDAFRAVGRSVESLATFAPAPEFAERVMAEVRIRELAEVVMAPTTLGERLVRWVRDRAPSTRQGWAAAMGVAVAPVFTVVLLVRAVFSHELVTVGSLFSFLRLRTGGMLNGVTESASGLLAEFAPGALVDGFVWITSSPAASAAALALVSVSMLASVWILYRNVLNDPLREPEDATFSW